MESNISKLKSNIIYQNEKKTKVIIAISKHYKIHLLIQIKLKFIHIEIYLKIQLMSSTKKRILEKEVHLFSNILCKFM